jgi:uncharacterized protein (DUF1778 family)
MPVVRERSTKTERLEIRLSPATRLLLTQAARMRHTTITQFLISSAVTAAQDALVQPKLFEITTDAGWAALNDALDRHYDEPPNEALVAALRAARPAVA